MFLVRFLTAEIAWKRLKSQHFIEEDIRLLQLQDQGNGFSTIRYGGYWQSPSRYYPDIPYQVDWIYIVNLDSDKFLVSIIDYGTRVFCLKNIPRWLFESSSATTVENTWIGNDYRILIDPVYRLHLAASCRPAEPDPALVALYQSCTPQLRPLHFIPGKETFPVRKYLRLLLLKHFFKTHQATFGDVNNFKHSFFIRVFHLLAYVIVNLARSAVEVGFQHVTSQNTPAHCETEKNGIIDPGCQPPATTEYWIDGVLVILERDISTMENLQAAIGKAIQITNASGCSPTRGTIPSAVICSLSAIVLVYIRGNEISHTSNLHFFPHHTIYNEDEAETDGVLALLDIFYRPSPPAEPQSFPGPYKHLPTEICQNIFFYACPSTRSALGASCRVFRDISHDYGVRIGDYYFQRQSEENGGSAFIGSVDGFVHRNSVRVRATCTRRTVVYLVADIYYDHHRAILCMPDSQVLRPVLPLASGEEDKEFPPKLRVPLSAH